MISFIVWWVAGFFTTTWATDNSYVGALGGLLAWWLACRVWRTRKCTGRCNGTGKIYDPADDTYWRNCGQCSGSGKQQRLFVR